MANRFHPKGYKNPQQIKAIKAKQKKQNRPIVSFMTDDEIKKKVAHLHQLENEARKEGKHYLMYKGLKINLA